jgi:hypothetical protein
METPRSIKSRKLIEMRKGTILFTNALLLLLTQQTVEAHSTQPYD